MLLLNFMTTNWNNNDIHNGKCIWISDFGYRSLFSRIYLNISKAKSILRALVFSLRLMCSFMIIPWRLRWMHHVVAERYINRFETTVNLCVYRNAGRFGVLTEIRLYSCNIFIEIDVIFWLSLIQTLNQIESFHAL